MKIGFSEDAILYAIVAVGGLVVYSFAGSIFLIAGLFQKLPPSAEVNKPLVKKFSTYLNDQQKNSPPRLTAAATSSKAFKKVSQQPQKIQPAIVENETNRENLDIPDALRGYFQSPEKQLKLMQARQCIGPSSNEILESIIVANIGETKMNQADFDVTNSLITTIASKNNQLISSLASAIHFMNGDPECSAARNVLVEIKAYLASQAPHTFTN